MESKKAELYSINTISWVIPIPFYLLMILSCREQENLVGDVSGDTSLIIGLSILLNCGCVVKKLTSLLRGKFNNLSL